MALTKVHNRMIAGNIINVIDFGALGDFPAGGSSGTDDTTAIQNAINAVQDAGGGNLIFPATSGYYRIEGTVTADETVNFIMDGGVINVPSTGSLTINGGFANRNVNSLCLVTPSATSSTSAIKIRDTSDSTAISSLVNELQANWFSGSTMSQKIRSALQVGGSNTTVRIPPGNFTINTTISLDQSDYGNHLTLRGESHIASTLEMEANCNRVGIDASNGDECLLDNIRVTEATGTRTGVGLLVGGTSLVVNNCWFGNTKYGILANGGSGMHLSGCYIESCDQGFMIASNFADHNIGSMSEPSSVLNHRIDRLFVFNCGAANSADDFGLYVTGKYVEFNISSASGSFTDGETITGGTSGATATLFTSTSSEMIVSGISGTFTNGETLTGGTSAKTATLDSQNNNDVRDIQFTALQVSQCDRYGALFEDCSGITVQGNVTRNGTDSTSVTGGAKVGDNVEDMVFHGCRFADTKADTSTSYGLDINGNSSKVVVTGCIATNDQTTDQDVGIRTDKATTVISSCILTGNNTTAIQDDGPSPTTSVNIT